MSGRQFLFRASAIEGHGADPRARRRACKCPTCGELIPTSRECDGISYLSPRAHYRRREVCHECLDKALGVPGETPQLRGVVRGDFTYLIEVPHYGAPQNNPDVAGVCYETGFTPYLMPCRGMGVVWRLNTPNAYWHELMGSLECVGYNMVVTCHVRFTDGSTPSVSKAALKAIKSIDGVTNAINGPYGLKVRFRFSTKTAAQRILSVMRETLKDER